MQEKSQKVARSLYKTKDASAVAEAVFKSAETFQQADTLVDTPVSGANDQHLISH
jgi:hypothetical protein